MDTEWLKSQMDKLRAEASRGAVPSATIFNLTDPIMDRIARGDPVKRTKQENEDLARAMGLRSW